MKKKISLVLCVAYLVSLLSGMCVFARTDFQPSWPLRNGFNISALDAYQSGGAHRGIDVGHGNMTTQKVYAVAYGIVTDVGNNCSHHNDYPHANFRCAANSLGNYVTIKHDVNGKVFYSQYAHLTKNSITVRVGDIVQADTTIGRMGSSGNSTGPHLHFSIWQDGYYNERARTFDFYKDNANLMKNLRIREKLAKTSSLYGSWIKKNGTLKNGLYYFDNASNNTVTNPPVSNNTPPAPKYTKPVIDMTQYPTTITQGKSFGLRGTIYSENNVTSVKGYIVNSNNVTVMSTEDSPYAKTNNVRYMSLNNDMLFNKLSAGTYTMIIKAKDSSGGDWTTWSRAFTVKSTSNTNAGNTSSNNTSSSNTNSNNTSSSQSSVRIYVESYPQGNLPYGKSFTLSGKFTSDCAIVEAKAYMLDSNYNVIMEAKGHSTTNNYYIKGYALDNGMKFNKLQRGGYYLRYYVKDANGDTATWTSNMFYIV